MGIPTHQYLEMLARTERSRVRQPESGDAVTMEIPLHNKIIEHCHAQWPRWKYIHSNPAVKSTIAKGASDFTIFLPGGKVVSIECKSKTGKLGPDQLAWQREMAALGHIVHVVRSLEEFKEVCRTAMQERVF